MNKHTLEYLRQLNLEMKSEKPALINKVFRELFLLNFKGNIECEIYASYLIGKFYYHLFKKTELYYFLEKAVKFHHNVFVIARINKIKVNDSNYFFKYANTLFELSKISSPDMKEHLCNKAFLIAVYQGEKYPNNSSFNWLQLRILQA